MPSPDNSTEPVDDGTDGGLALMCFLWHLLLFWPSSTRYRYRVTLGSSGRDHQNTCRDIT